MRPFKMLALSLFALTTAMGTMAQTADEIVSKHVEAMGGAEKLKTLKTVYSEGTLTLPGVELPIKIYQINEKAMRLEFELQGTDNIQVVTSDAGWVFMPVQQMTEATDMPDEQLKLARKGLTLTGELFDYKAKGKTVEFVGKESAGGKDVYKLKVTDTDKIVTTLIIDASTYYVLSSESEVSVQGQSATVKNVFKDYKKTPEGYVFPYVSEQTVGPQSFSTSMTKVEVNKPIDEAIFKKPA